MTWIILSSVLKVLVWLVLSPPPPKNMIRSGLIHLLILTFVKSIPLGPTRNWHFYFQMNWYKRYFNQNQNAAETFLHEPWRRWWNRVELRRHGWPWRWGRWWQQGVGRSHGWRASSVLRRVVFERKLQEELFGFLVPKGPEFRLRLVDFSGRDLKGDGLVGLGGEQQILPFAIWNVSILQIKLLSHY